MSKKQELARRRNWLKARLMGFPFPIDNTPLTDYEILLFGQMKLCKNELLENWDTNSSSLGMLTKARCTTCGKKESKKNPILEKVVWGTIRTICTECWEEFTK